MDILSLRGAGSATVVFLKKDQNSRHLELMRIKVATPALWLDFVRLPNAARAVPWYGAKREEGESQSYRVSTA